MVEPLRHRQTKGAETDMPGLPPPRHFPTLPFGRICSTCSPAALRSSTASAEFRNQAHDSYREEIGMRRRDLLKATGAGVAVLAAPRIGRAEKTNKLVFAPAADLSVLDPVVTGYRPTRNHAYLVFDTLYGIDTSWTAQPQMVEGHQVEEDGLTWTLTLRDGLRFHDKEPVLARDVVISIRRFAERMSFVSALMAATEELSAPDDRTVRFRLKRPFPHLPEALAGPGGIVPAIMPERLAATSPFTTAAASVGSGPYRFLPEEHISGARAAYERFPLYQPRAGEPLGFTSGPKIAHFDRVE